MDSLLASTEVHTVFLDRELTIRKFTPKIADVFNLLPQDVGRRIDNFTHHIEYGHNAAKYTPPEGTIWLSVERQGGEAVVRVRDTGAGIPADMLETIFDLFVQNDRTLDRADGGMGVGLTLVRTLVACTAAQ